MVTHPSCLTSVILRELVFPTWYCRSSNLVLPYYCTKNRQGRLNNGYRDERNSIKGKVLTFNKDHAEYKRSFETLMFFLKHSMFPNSAEHTHVVAILFNIFAGSASQRKLVFSKIIFDYFFQNWSGSGPGSKLGQKSGLGSGSEFNEFGSIPLILSL